MAELRSIARAVPAHVDEMVAYLEEKIERARAGEWETIFFIGICPNGSWFTGNSGKDRTSMEKIGLLATMLHDTCDAGVK